MSILQWLCTPIKTIRRQPAPSPSPAMRYHPWLEALEQRTTPSGDFGMAFRIGSSGVDQANSVSLDASGNPHVTGYFEGTVDFDPGPGVFNLSGGGQDIFVAKYTPAGGLIWAVSMSGQGGSSRGEGNALAVDSAGNVYTTGWFTGTVDFDPGPDTFNLTSIGPTDVFISKLDRDGNFVWAKSFGSPSIAPLSSILAVDGAGNVYTTGGFTATADFDPGPGTFNLSNAGASDIFVLKLDSAGNFVWARSMGGAGGEWGRALAVDGAGNIAITGSFDGTVDFDPGAGTFELTSAGEDIFVSKLDNAGNFVWAKSQGGAGVDVARALTVDAAGNLYSTGAFQGTADFDPGPGTFNLSAGFKDIFVSKLDGDGNFVWARRLGSPVWPDQGLGIAVDSAGNVYTSGNFGGTADFDPGPGTFNLTSSGNTNMFVSKLDAAGDFVWARHMGGSSAAEAREIAVDRAGNVYAAGAFSGPADFDPGPGTFTLTSASEDGFLLRLVQRQGFSSHVAGDGQLFALDEFGELWCYSVGNARWVPMGAYGASVSVGNLGDSDPDNDLVFLHASDGGVWVWNRQSWSFSGGWLRTLSAGDNQVFGIGLDGQLWCFHVDNGWTASGGYGVDIDVGNTGDGDAANDLVFVRGTDSAVWVWNQASWRFSGGWLPSITAGDNQVFGIGFDDQLWHFHVTRGWTASGGYGVDIAVGNTGDADAANDLLFLRSGDGGIWLWNQQSWTFSGGYLKEIRAGGEQLFGIGFDSQLWRFHVRHGWTPSGGFGIDVDVGGDDGNDLAFLRAADGAWWVWNQGQWMFAGA